MNEQCEERIRRLTAKDANGANEDGEKNTIITKLEKIKSVTSKQDVNQKAIDIKEEQLEHKDVTTTAEKPIENSKKEDIPLPENKEQIKGNVAMEEKKPSPSPQKPKIKEEQDEREEINGEVNLNLAKADEEDDEPKAEDVEDPNKEPENDEVERENLINMDGQPEDENDLKQIQQNVEKLNDYNGDEANEAESETEKQVELRANDQNLRGVKIENELNELGVNQQAEEDQDARLK